MVVSFLFIIDKFRWSMGRTYDYWVPRLCWVSEEEYGTVKTMLDGLPSQNKASHFQWKDYIKLENHTTHIQASHYHIMRVATHWQHKYYSNNKWAMFDFTQDWIDKPEDNTINNDDDEKLGEEIELFEQ